ncbi:unnamed protein product [Ectocarpus sp. 8 AP-2014]
MAERASPASAGGSAAAGKRLKTGRGGSREGGLAGPSADTDMRKRKRLLADAVKIPSTTDESLGSFLDLVKSVQCIHIFQASPPISFVQEMLAHLLRLLPRAATTLDGASTFIACLEPFEDLEEFVFPANFFRAIISAKEPPRQPPSPHRGHNWKAKNRRLPPGEVSSAAGLLPSQAPKVTGLQTLREYLCMNGRDTVDCGRRTVVATLTRALLGSWEGSATMVRSLGSSVNTWSMSF